MNKICIFIMSCSILLTMRSVADKVVEKIKTHISCSITFFFRLSCHLVDKIEKYCRAGRVTDDNMAHAHFMLDT